MAPKPYEIIGFGDIHGPKPYEFIGFGDIHGPKPYEFIWFGDIHGPKSCEFIGFGPCSSAGLRTALRRGSWRLDRRVGRASLRETRRSGRPPSTALTLYFFFCFCAGFRRLAGSPRKPQECPRSSLREPPGPGPKNRLTHSSCRAHLTGSVSTPSAHAGFHSADLCRILKIPDRRRNMPKSGQNRSQSLCAGLWAPCRAFWAW